MSPQKFHMVARICHGCS